MTLRILVISDIHANLQALEAVLRDAGRTDEIWCAGDLVDYGTDPHGVVSWFRTHAVRCVSGNHDRHLLNVLASGETETLRGTDRWKWVHDNCDRVTDEDVAYLRSLPMALQMRADGISYLMCHQLGEDAYAYRTPESIAEFNDFWQAHGTQTEGERRLILGHTHRRCVHLLDQGMLWLNPGSASYRRPDDPDKRAHYIIIDGGRIELRAVDYDRRPSYRRALEYARSGHMLLTDLQDAMFFFGHALTSRDPIPTDTEGELE